MRIALAFALTAAIASPSYGQIEENFALANRIFGQPTAAGVVSDIEGEWLPLSTLANAKGADPDPGLIASLLDRICGNDPSRGAIITEIDEGSFEMTAPNSGGDMVYRFDWISGSLFHRSFDPAALFSMLRLDAIEGERGSEMRARTLQTAASQVNLYRVSADLIALAEPYRTEIYGRCAT
ncbi:hypothetical protein DevBK_00595 [Devosia sp. BK]|uniref:hypothetical protein n=1 Tax=Devosia sp. BK TaxID=2871706 RepID=UPI00293A4BE1|nr:hypothetical protein [Devosia sp. BK]MDV3249817.1 hypothetical protein [Devosia sp. BK]